MQKEKSEVQGGVMDINGCDLGNSPALTSFKKPSKWNPEAKSSHEYDKEWCSEYLYYMI